jgi:hypothetical protein
MSRIAKIGFFGISITAAYREKVREGHGTVTFFIQTFFISNKVYT